MLSTIFALIPLLTIVASTPIEQIRSLSFLSTLDRRYFEELHNRANPPTCNCESPSGCPGHCTTLQGSGLKLCLGYCGFPEPSLCDACPDDFEQVPCIAPTAGNPTCFTVNE